MKYILISVGVLLLIIFGIVIFNVDRSPKTNPAINKAIKLSDYGAKNNATVEYTIDGAINASENHRSINITVGPTSRSVTVYTGYEGKVLTTSSYANDTNSYSDFLAALARAGFTKDRKVANNVNSQSVCPTGSRSFYKVVEDAKDVMNNWTASCTAGTFGGNVSLTNNLFKAQIPDYSTVTQGVSLSTSGSSSTGLVL